MNTLFVAVYHCMSSFFRLFSFYGFFSLWCGAALSRLRGKLVQIQDINITSYFVLGPGNKTSGPCPLRPYCIAPRSRRGVLPCAENAPLAAKCKGFGNKKVQSNSRKEKTPSLEITLHTSVTTVFISN